MGCVDTERRKWNFGGWMDIEYENILKNKTYYISRS